MDNLVHIMGWSDPVTALMLRMTCTSLYAVVPLEKSLGCGTLYPTDKRIYLKPTTIRRIGCIGEFVSNGKHIRLIAHAAKWGHLPIVIWLHTLDPSLHSDTWVCTAAASKGQRHIIRWARAHEPIFLVDKWTSAFAAQHGDLRFFKWLHVQSPPIPWSSATNQYAARYDNIPILEWVLKQDLDQRSVAESNSAFEEGHKHILEWIVEHHPYYITRDLASRYLLHLQRLAVENT